MFCDRPRKRWHLVCGACGNVDGGVRYGRALWRETNADGRTDGRTNTRARAIWDAIILTLQTAAASVAVAVAAAAAGRRRIRSVVGSGERARPVRKTWINWWRRRRRCGVAVEKYDPPGTRRRREICFFLLHETRGSVGRVCARFCLPVHAGVRRRLNRRRRRDLRWPSTAALSAAAVKLLSRAAHHHNRYLYLRSMVL